VPSTYDREALARPSARDVVEHLLGRRRPPHRRRDPGRLPRRARRPHVRGRII
jgi:hypothetical protein